MPSERDKQNFRYSSRQWAAAQEKAARMRRNGYDVDMTMVLSRATDQFVDEPEEVTVKRLGLDKADRPLALHRRPRPAGNSR